MAQGDTLYAIAWKKELDADDLARWNGLKPPYRIYPGQALRLNGSAEDAGEPERLAETPPAKAPVTKPPPVKDSGKPAVVPRPVPVPVPPKPIVPAKAPDTRPTMASTAWRWPAEGKTQTANAAGREGRQGLEIHGRLGDNIHATRNGKVVYAGSALKGYGLLLIVKHDDTFLSAYGYNDRLLVGDGDSVEAGQIIAKMGQGPKSEPLLYFEIRRNGRPTDPLKLLPPR